MRRWAWVIALSAVVIGGGSACVPKKKKPLRSDNPAPNRPSDESKSFSVDIRWSPSRPGKVSRVTMACAGSTNSGTITGSYSPGDAVATFQGAGLKAGQSCKVTAETNSGQYRGTAILSDGTTRVTLQGDGEAPAVATRVVIGFNVVVSGVAPIGGIAEASLSGCTPTIASSSLASTPSATPADKKKISLTVNLPAANPAGTFASCVVAIKTTDSPARIFSGPLPAFTVAAGAEDRELPLSGDVTLSETPAAVASGNGDVNINVEVGDCGQYAEFDYDSRRCRCMTEGTTYQVGSKTCT